MIFGGGHLYGREGKDADPDCRQPCDADTQRRLLETGNKHRGKGAFNFSENSPVCPPSST